MSSGIAGATPPAPRATAASPRRPVLRPLTDLLLERRPDDAAPLRASTPPPRPDAHAQAMAQRVLRGAVEIVGGHRPAHQLATVLRPGLLDYLLELRTAAAHLGPRLGTVHLQHPSDDVLETVAVVVLRTGVRALSARFERPADTGGWRCTALHLPLTRGDLRRRRR